MIVITLSKVPPSLRGVLTKWCQELQTGVYVGRFSARIRDELWERIQRDIGKGEASMAYNAQNELGYQFRTTRAHSAVVDYDGLPLMMRLNSEADSSGLGFSDAAKYRRAKKFSHVTKGPSSPPKVRSSDFIVLDIETTGLNPGSDAILSLAAIRNSGGQEVASFNQIVATTHEIPNAIQAMTGLTSAKVTEVGIPLDRAIFGLKDFLRDSPIVGYNIHFDEDFLMAGFATVQSPRLTNRFIDLMPIVKRINKFLDSYKLSSVLSTYEIDNLSPHHALDDAHATMLLASKLIENGSLQISEG